MKRWLWWLFVLPVVAQAQLETKADSVILFQAPVKTWYVQTLEEIAPELMVKKSDHPGIEVITYSEKPAALNDHYVIAEKQNYSWKLSEIDLGYGCSVDSVYLGFFWGKQILYMHWSHSDGVSTGEFHWHEWVKGLMIYDLTNDLILLNEVIYKDEGHTGSSVNEESIKGRKTGFNEEGMYITNEKEMVATEIIQVRDIKLKDEVTLHMTLKSLDPHDQKKVVREWPEVIYKYSSQAWKKVN